MLWIDYIYVQWGHISKDCSKWPVSVIWSINAEQKGEDSNDTSDVASSLCAVLLVYAITTEEKENMHGW